MLDTNELTDWIRNYLPVPLKGTNVELERISGDAGFREYFRINCEPSMLATYAPPEYENNLAFVRIGTELAGAGVHVPRVFAVDYQRGYLIQEDLGAALYLKSLGRRTADTLYNRAQAVLLTIQSLNPDQEIFPAYSNELLRDEMTLFTDWFVHKLLGQSVTSSTQIMLDCLFEQLIGNAITQPQVIAHRDYHSRNLLVLPEAGVGVIDFQDAVIGPCTYDLVSLLRDCYVRWPESWVRKQRSNYLNSAKEAGLLPEGLSESDYARWFDLMGLQRHIKVLGIFARLFLRDGKADYLDDLPLVIRYTLEVAGSYSETRDFYEWFTDTLTGPLASQNWYRDWRSAGDI
jgi:N-acetylmuramate 1-kinase